MKPLIFQTFLFVLILSISKCESQSEHYHELELDDNCSQYKDCSECILSGCNFCSSGMTTSRCTSVKDAKTAKCDMSTCATDIFITKVSECSGGCSNAANCDSCIKIPECGWCFMSDACVEVDKNGKLLSTKENCEIISSDSCSTPCELEPDCYGCSLNKGCSWCGGSDGSDSGKCVKDKSSSSDCSKKCDLDNLTQEKPTQSNPKDNSIQNTNNRKIINEESESDGLSFSSGSGVSSGVIVSIIVLLGLFASVVYVLYKKNKNTRTRRYGQL